MSILSRSSELKHPLRNSKKPSSDLMSNKGLSYVREKIRTPDLLVRSQTLYPAELRAHIIFVCFSYLCTSATKLIIAQRFLSVNNFFKIFQIIFLSSGGLQVFLFSGRFFLLLLRQKNPTMI